jgi:hypothetical protein
MLEFVIGMQLPEDVISKKAFPGVFAYVERYQAAVEKAKSNAPHRHHWTGLLRPNRCIGPRLGSRKCPLIPKILRAYRKARKLKSTQPIGVRSTGTAGDWWDWLQTR